MATEVQLIPAMSTTEVNRTWRFVFTDDMLSGATILSATATHTPPSGSAATPVTNVVSPETNADGTQEHVVYVTLPAAAVTGRHYLECKAVVDNTGSVANETLSIRGWFVANY